MIGYNPDTNKLRAVFHTPYRQYEDREGQKFSIISRMTDAECAKDGYEPDDNGSYDFSSPRWFIRFEDGFETNAWAEEIFEDEDDNK